MALKVHNHYKTIPPPREKISRKKKKPKQIAVIDQDNCTGCEVCVDFCPVDCIKPDTEAERSIPIPPVKVLLDKCIGCQICVRVCNKLTWDAIRMVPTPDVEERFGVQISDTYEEAVSS